MWVPLFLNYGFKVGVRKKIFSGIFYVFEDLGRYCDLENAANRRFDDDYVGDMKYSAVRGSNKGGDEIFSAGKGKYHSSRGIDSTRNFFRNKDVSDRFSKANDEPWDYNDGNYEYVKGQ